MASTLGETDRLHWLTFGWYVGEIWHVDYAGMAVPVFIDKVEHDAQLFVVSMGVSGRAYAEVWRVNQAGSPDCWPICDGSPGSRAW